jgi:hypothetical protein
MTPWSRSIMRSTSSVVHRLRLPRLPTTYDTRGLSHVCLQASTIDKFVGSLILQKNQWHVFKTVCHCYTLNLWRVQIDCYHSLFPEPRMTTEWTSNNAFFVLSIIVRCDGDQITTYRQIFLGPSSIPIIGDYISFFVISDITAISLFPIVIVMLSCGREWVYFFYALIRKIYRWF